MPSSTPGTILSKFSRGISCKFPSRLPDELPVIPRGIPRGSPELNHSGTFGRNFFVAYGYIFEETGLKFLGELPVEELVEFPRENLSVGLPEEFPVKLLEEWISRRIPSGFFRRISKLREKILKHPRK